MGKNIFNNYLPKCPKCNAELNPDDLLCQYCGENLQNYNKEYKDDEKQVIDAMEEVDKAKRHLYQTRILVEKNSYKKSKERKRLIIITVLTLLFVGVIALGLIGTFVENVNDERVKQKEQELSSQVVNTITIESLQMENLNNFTNTEHRSAVGYILENDKYYKIPFYADSYHNNLEFDVEIILDKFDIQEVYSFDEDYVAISTEDFGVRINVENGAYYEEEVEALILIDSTIDEVVRLEDVIIDNIRFETYRIDEEYYLIANPKPDLFITYEITFNIYDVEEFWEKYNKEHNTDFNVSTKMMPLEVFNMLKGINIEIA